MEEEGYSFGGKFYLDTGGYFYKVKFAFPNKNGELIVDIIKDYPTEKSISISYKKVFLGYDPQAMFWGTNCLLLEIGLNRYIFVGQDIYEFNTDSPITALFGPLGNSTYSDAYAISKTHIYLLAYEYVAIPIRSIPEELQILPLYTSYKETNKVFDAADYYWNSGIKYQKFDRKILMKYDED